MNGTPMVTWSRRPQVREHVAAVALAAVMLRALIPFGYMPSATGPAPLVICTGWALISTQAAGDVAPIPGSHRVAGICPFAVASTLLAPPDVAPASLRADLLDDYVPIDDSITPAALAGPPRAQSSRAPPALI